MFKKLWLILFPVWLLAQPSLSLQECLDEAMKNNLSLQRKQNEVDSARAFRNSVRAQFFPSIDFSGTYLRLNKQFSLFENDVLMPLVPYMVIDQQTGKVDPSKFNDPIIAATYLVIDPQTMKPVTDKDGNPIFRNYAWLPADKAKLGVKDNYLLQFSLKQPVFLGGKIWYGYKIARQLENIYALQKEATEENIMSDIIEKYMQIVVTWQRIKVIQQYKQMISKIMEDLNNYKQEGIVTELEVQQVKTRYNEVVLNELQASQGLVMLRMFLNQKMGRPLASFWIPKDTAFTLPEVTLDTAKLLNDAMSSRVELKMLDEKIKLSAYQQRMTYGDMLPQIGFLANYLIMKPSPYQGFKNVFDNDYQLGVSIVIPLVHAGDKWYHAKMANIAAQNDVLMKQEAEALIKLDVMNKYFAYTEVLQKIVLTTEKLKQQELNLKQKTDLFNEGMIKSTDILQAQSDWFNAEVDKLDAISSAWVAYYQLLKASGKLK